MTYGITPQGFVIKPFGTCLSDINAAFQSAFGATVDLSPSQPFGLLASILATQQFNLWQLAQATYKARDPDAAQGAGLIELAAITGTIPVIPTQSSATLLLTGTNGTAIVTGQTVSGANSGPAFTTQAAVTLVTGTAWATGTTYATGAVRYANGNTYYCTAGGLSAAGGSGPSGTGSAIVDNLATWAFAGAGTASATVQALSVLYGAVVARAGSLTVISTPVAGWSGAYNGLDAILGTAPQSDAQLRIRRQQELAASGNATVAGIQAQLTALVAPSGGPLLTAANVFENPTDNVDGYGLPPHSINVVALYPGAPISATDTSIATAILNTKAAGIKTFGAQSKVVTDSQGYAQTINFDYPTAEWVWVQVSVTAKAATFPGIAAVQSAITNYAQGVYPEFAGYIAGSTVYSSPLSQMILDQVGGVLDVTSIGTAITAVGGGTPGSYTSAGKASSRVQLPQFDSTRISVSVVLV